MLYERIQQVQSHFFGFVSATAMKMNVKLRLSLSPSLFCIQAVTAIYPLPIAWQLDKKASCSGVQAAAAKTIHGGARWHEAGLTRSCIFRAIPRYLHICRPIEDRLSLPFFLWCQASLRPMELFQPEKMACQRRIKRF